MIRPSTGLPLELDVCIPELQLAMEYQGQQHYKSIFWFGADLAAQKQRDHEKIDVCKKVLTWVILSEFTARNFSR